jgi:hypothetical protein
MQNAARASDFFQVDFVRLIEQANKLIGSFQSSAAWFNVCLAINVRRKSKWFMFRVFVFCIAECFSLDLETLHSQKNRPYLAERAFFQPQLGHF